MIATSSKATKVMSNFCEELVDTFPRAEFFWRSGGTVKIGAVVVGPQIEYLISVVNEDVKNSSESFALCEASSLHWTLERTHKTIQTIARHTNHQHH